MIISNSLINYSKEEIATIAEKISTMSDLFKKTNEIFMKESKNMTETTDNVVFIDTSIKQEYNKLKDIKLPLHEIVEIYTNWHKELFYLAMANIGQYHIISVQQHVEGIANICKTFPELMKKF